MRTKRQTYRADHRAEIDAIDKRRRNLGVTAGELCRISDVSLSTWLRMRKGGLAFRRHIVALQMGLRTAAQKARNQEVYLP